MTSHSNPHFTEADERHHLEHVTDRIDDVAIRFATRLFGPRIRFQSFAQQVAKLHENADPHSDDRRF